LVSDAPRLLEALLAHALLRAAMTISQLFVLAPNGHTIVHKDYRGDVSKDAPEIFLRKVVDKLDAPIFTVDGVNYVCVRKNGITFLATTVYNVPPAFIIELLTQLTKVCKDYIGVLNEESLRKNFTLVYELVDEILDFGWPQSASTAELQPFIFNKAAEVSASKETVSRTGLSALKAAPKTMSSKAVHKPISMKNEGTGKNEIFVDVIDRISATFDSSGRVRTFAIDGSIQMKSYLTGEPTLHLALNNELVIAGMGQRAGYGMIELDNVNFHECVNVDQFEADRMLTLQPPHGEFVLMNFHIGSMRSESQIPFRISPMLSALSEYKQELRLQIRAEFPDKFHGANVKVVFTVPKSSTGATVELAPGAKQQTWEYDDATKSVTWLIRKFPGGSTQAVSCKFVVKSETNVAKEMGPVSLAFEIPMYNISQLQVQHLKIVERNKSYNPHRWVRCLTHAESYVCRMGAGS
jgi:AP-4 complex subunit mu-1